MIDYSAEEIECKDVTCGGWLRTEGARILNQKNQEMQLVGISTHGIQWFGELYSADTIAHLKSELGITVFRVAMYVDPSENGYVSNHALKDKIYELVDACIEQDIYVIVDWHILNDNNPQIHQGEALVFFDEVSAKYKDTPNVIYEICNEPNSGADWSSNIKPYAEQIIAKIRENSPNALVIVGTPDWSKDLTSVGADPLQLENVAYALHFYAGSHNKTLRDKIDNFREKNLAVFVSECSSTTADGNGQLFEDAFGRWVDYMNEKKISWVYWSLSNKDEGSAMLVPEYKPELLRPADDGMETKITDYFSESGKLFQRAIQPEEDEEAQK